MNQILLTTRGKINIFNAQTLIWSKYIGMTKTFSFFSSEYLFLLSYYTHQGTKLDVKEYQGYVCFLNIN